MTLATTTRSVVVCVVGLAVVASACGNESAGVGSVTPATTTFEPVIVDTTESPVQSSTPATTVPPPAPTTPPPTPPTVDVSSAAEFTMGTTATYDDGSTVVVLAYTQPFSDPNSILGPPNGYEFAVATVRICAGDLETKFLDQTSWGAVGGAGEAFKQSLRATPIGTGLVTLPLQPGACVEGNVGFEVVIGQLPAFVLWSDPAWESAKWQIA